MSGIVSTETVALSELTLYPGNARQGDVNAIAESLSRNEQYRALVVRSDTKEVLAGNHTLLAMRELGWSEALVHLVEVDDDEARRIVLADNRTNDLATYDDANLVTLLAALKSDYVGTGFGEQDLAYLLESLREEAPEAPDDFDDPESGMSTDYQCPQCGYKWSGLQVGDPK